MNEPSANELRMMPKFRLYQEAIKLRDQRDAALRQLAKATELLDMKDEILEAYRQAEAEAEDGGAA